MDINVIRSLPIYIRYSISVQILTPDFCAELRIVAKEYKSFWIAIR